jgi:subtilisin family serine protease
MNEAIQVLIVALVASTLPANAARDSIGGVQPGAPWHLDILDSVPETLFDASYSYSHTGSNVTVYILGQGDIQSSEHPEFTGRAGNASSRRKSRGECDGDGAMDYIASLVGGTTFGVAKDVQVVGINNGGCAVPDLAYTADVLAAFEWLTVNIRLPAVVLTTFSARGVAPQLVEAVTALLARGATVVAAAGFFGDDECLYWPGRMFQVITIGAVDKDLKQLEQSNGGFCVSLMAAGESIQGLSSSARNGSEYRQGTASAAALAAGVAAQYLEQHPEAGPQGMWAAAHEHVPLQQKDKTHAPLQANAQMRGCTRLPTASAEVSRFLQATAIPGRLSVTPNTPNLLLNIGPAAEVRLSNPAGETQSSAGEHEAIQRSGSYLEEPDEPDESPASPPPPTPGNTIGLAAQTVHSATLSCFCCRSCRTGYGLQWFCRPLLLAAPAPHLVYRACLPDT